MPGVAVGDRDEADAVAGGRPLRTRPPARMSQSSGCAPKAMMLSGAWA